MDKDFQPIQIGNSLTKQFVHDLRSKEHAILIGTQTALNDNPSLTTREVVGRNPVRILIDFDLKVPENFKIFNTEAKTLIFNSEKNFEKENLKFIKVEKENFLNDLMKKLYGEQIQSVLIEGGSFTLQKFMEADLWDEIIIIKNENLALNNGTKSPKVKLNPVEIQTFRDNKIHFYRKNEI